MSSKKYNHTNKKIGDRLKFYRKTKGINTVNLSNLLNISQGALSGLENSKSKPSSDTLANFYKNTDINIGWLLTGEGEMTRNPENEVCVAENTLIYNKEEKHTEDAAADEELKNKLIQTQDELIGQLKLIRQLEKRLAETEEKLKASEELADKIRTENENSHRGDILKKKAM